MLKVRNNIFETNSSSTHCLVWHDTSIKQDKNKYDIYAGYFGRTPMEPLANIEDRLSYLWTAILESSAYWEHNKECLNEDTINKWLLKLQTIVPNAIFHMPKIHSGEYYNGYEMEIDHFGELEEWVKTLWNNNDMLINFICDPSAYILISGDEYDEYEEPFNKQLWPSSDEFGYDWNTMYGNNNKVLTNNKNTYIYHKGC